MAIAVTRHSSQTVESSIEAGARGRGRSKASKRGARMAAGGTSPAVTLSRRSWFPVVFFFNREMH